MLEARGRLRRALDSLPEPQRQVVVLKDVYDWSHAEIAEAMGISRTTSQGASPSGTGTSGPSVRGVGMNVLCEVAAPFVANSAVEGSPVARPFRAHADECLKYQARHAAMARIARELAAMSQEKFNAPLDLEWRVMSALEGDLAVARSGGPRWR